MKNKNQKLSLWQLLGSRLITALTIFVLGKSLAPLALAAAPEVTVDETAYVLLDYYGKEKNLTVVKACDLYGNTQIQDRGNYQSVTNMTTLDEPIITTDGVTWNLKAEELPRRFYYQVIPREQTFNLPWTIDVSYKLNGVPMQAEKIAGQAGLLEIEVAVTPNTKVSSYMADNFILTAGMLVDNDDNYSFSAPGAQLQTLGNYQVAFFVAMPEEETTFHFTIGSDDLETNGVILAMMPATLSQLDQMREVRDHKENIEDAGRAIDRTFDDIFTIMTAMTGGIDQTINGLSQLEETRTVIDQAKEENKKATNSMVSSINDLTDKVNEMDNLQDDQAYQIINETFGENIWMKRSNQVLAVGDSGKGMVNNMSTFANAMKKTVDANGDNLNEGTKQTLQGVTTMMTNMSAAMSKTADLQKNKNTISRVTKDEWKRLDEELNIINVDTGAEKESLTGDDEAALRSVQIILRTQEISKTKNTEEANQNKTSDEETVNDRLKIVFAKIGETFLAWSR